MRLVLVCIMTMAALMVGCSKCSRDEAPMAPPPATEQANPTDQGGNGETLPPGDSLEQQVPPDEEMQGQPVEDEQPASDLPPADQPADED